MSDYLSAAPPSKVAAPDRRTEQFDVERLRKYGLPKEFLEFASKFAIEEREYVGLSLSPGATLYEFIEAKNGPAPNPREYGYVIVGYAGEDFLIVKMAEHQHDECTVFVEDRYSENIKPISPSVETLWCLALETNRLKRDESIESWKLIKDRLDLNSLSPEMISEFRRTLGPTHD